MSNTMTAPTTLTYPISPDYVKAGHGGTGWTVERALAEFIANALDEDPNASVTYANGTLTIEDNGPGIPEEGLLLGYSPKGDAQIGQFGEGSKIGALVLARDESIGDIHIETVGYAFTPTVERRRVLDGIAPRRTDEAPEVLVYTFAESTRTAGTKVTVQVSKKVADATTARFRHLSEADYTPPTTAQIITDAPKGRLYIGGVYVTTQKGLFASYDFPLSQAKTAQNRDRTVIATEVLNDLIRSALAQCLDIDVHRTFVTKVLAGGRLTDAERYFSRVNDPRVIAVFRSIARDMFGDIPTFYASPGQEEAALDLLDKNVHLVKTNLDNLTNDCLMSLLGVQFARAARRNLAREERKGTKYIPLNRLTSVECSILDTAKDMVRSVFGPESFDTIKVYGETSRYMACTLGFYDPTTGSIALSRDILSDLTSTMETLIHEVGHRLAHRNSGGEYADRTRGFEHQLGVMAAYAVMRLAGSTDTDAPTPVQESKASRAKVADAADLNGVVVQIPEERVVLSEVMNARLNAVKGTYRVKTGTALMKALGRHTGNWSLLATPRAAGWRRSPGSMSPSLIADYRGHQVIADALGISTPALWLAHLACEAHGYGKRNGAIDGPWKRNMAEAAPLLAEDFDAMGQPENAALIREHANGNGTPQALRDLALRLIAAERDKALAGV